MGKTKKGGAQLVLAEYTSYEAKWDDMVDGLVQDIKSVRLHLVQPQKSLSTFTASPCDNGFVVICFTIVHTHRFSQKHSVSLTPRHAIIFHYTPHAITPHAIILYIMFQVRHETIHLAIMPR